VLPPQTPHPRPAPAASGTGGPTCCPARSEAVEQHSISHGSTQHNRATLSAHPGAINALCRGQPAPAATAAAQWQLTVSQRPGRLSLFNTPQIHHKQQLDLCAQQAQPANKQTAAPLAQSWSAICPHWLSLYSVHTQGGGAVLLPFVLTTNCWPPLRWGSGPLRPTLM
jgi:hypothetical protein